MKFFVKSCGDCPFLQQNGEYPESRCSAANRTWGMGFYKGGPSPEWCPLRKESVEVMPVSPMARLKVSKE